MSHYEPDRPSVNTSLSLNLGVGGETFDIVSPALQKVEGPVLLPSPCLTPLVGSSLLITKIVSFTSMYVWKDGWIGAEVYVVCM